MKRVIFFAGTVLLLCTQVQAQVYNGDLIFSNQADIDNFSTAPFTSVNGNLRIQDDLDGQHNITNLAGLAGLTVVSGVVDIIFNEVLTNTAFLNLQSIGVGLSVRNNPALTTINGMGTLTLLPGQLHIENNNGLTAVTAFNNLATVGNLNIQQNLLLTNLNGFSNLTSVTTSFILDNNNSLTDLNAFNRLISVGSSFIIRNHTQLSNINGLSGLRRTGALIIANNILLTNLTGLSNIEVISGGLEVQGNFSLQTINGFPALDTLGGISIIKNNFALLTIGGFQQLTRMGSLFIETNPVLSSISGFASLKSANTIKVNANVSLTSITGFSLLDTINQELAFSNNHNLETIMAFSHLVFVRQRMGFVNNYVLASVNAMPQLDSVGYLDMRLDTVLANADFLSTVRKIGNILIVSCSQLTNLNFLSNLQGHITDAVSIGINDRLTNINGLSGISSVGQTLNIESNPSLTSLQGLQNIKKVGLDLRITGSPLLTNVHHLISIDSLGRDLVISSNAGLTNLDGLRNMRIVRGVVAVENNLLLSSFCGLYNLYNNGGPGLGTLINNNLVNPTAQQIIDAGPCTLIPVPVRLQAFNLRCESNKIILTWVTASEDNNSHFVLQRSSDGSAWIDLGVIPAAGNNGGETKYSFIDEQPLSSSFYRLAQYDIDGKVNYSFVITYRCTVENNITLWPNPASDKVFISVHASNASPGILRMYDSRGVLIKSKSLIILPGLNQFEVNLVGIPQGMYVLDVVYDGGSLQKNKLLLKR